MLRLYNLKVDPQEMQDLAMNPEYAPKLQSLMADFKTLQTELDDPLDLENPGPPDFTVKPQRH